MISPACDTVSRDWLPALKIASRHTTGAAGPPKHGLWLAASLPESAMLVVLAQLAALPLTVR